MTIRIDQLKDLAPDAMRSAHDAGDRWFISKRNHVEGVVVRQNLGDVMPADLTPPAEFREIDIYRGKLAEKPPPLGLRKGSGLGCSSPKDPKVVTV